jgi:hypothetical protein
LTDRAETVTSSKQTVVTPAVEKKYVTFEATVSTDDTITIGDLASILFATIVAKSDGAEMDCSVATNVITVTQVGATDEPVVGFAYGT